MSWRKHRHLGRFIYLALVALPSVLAACGGSVTREEEKRGSGGDSPYIFVGGTTSTGGSATGGGSGGEPIAMGGAGTGGDPFMEMECPDEPLNPPLNECDPLAPELDCPQGYGCYPYLVYPRGEGCGAPEFGAICGLAGIGRQGEFCGDSNGTCAPGFMCIVGAAGGKRCAQICEPIRDHDCPPGLVCGETDVQGYGVCF